METGTRRRFLERIGKIITGYALGSRLHVLGSPISKRLLSSDGSPPGIDGAIQPSEVQPFTHALDFFPVMPWEPLHGWKPPYSNPKHGLESIAGCNFTVAGFVQPGDLPLCEQLGLAAIMAPVPSEKPWFGEWTKLSDAEIDRTVKKMVEAAGDSPAILGYFIMDEPGSPAFPALSKAVKAVKKYAPGKLAYINLFPSYATVGAPDKSQLGTATYTEYLERFITEVKPQIISYDNYMVQYSDDMQDQQKAAMYYADLLEVRRVAKKYGRPFWNIVSSNQIRKQTTIPSPTNLAFQAYTTLAAGGRGVSWFRYYQGGYAYAPIDNAGKKTLTWRYLQAINHQLRTLGPIINGLTSTGVFFSSRSSVPGLPLLPGRILTRVGSIASPRGFSQLEPPIMMGEFVDGRSQDYVMVVNLSLERSTNIKVSTRKTYRAKTILSAEDGRFGPLDEEHGYWLPAGHGVLIKFT